MSLLPRPATLPSNAQLSALLDGVDELLLLLDARLRVSYRNQAAQRLLGCEPGQPLDAALARVDDHSARALKQALTAGQAPAALNLALGLVASGQRGLPGLPCQAHVVAVFGRRIGDRVAPQHLVGRPAAGLEEGPVGGDDDEVGVLHRQRLG